ncbi:MAG: MFS transporter [Clostridia bacterium]|nr:MFS transporter [Clostridia bacterium]
MAESALQNKTYGIKMSEKIGYALGDTAGLLIFALVGSFLQMFYTNVLYIDPAKVTVLFLIARIWDAVNDPIWGAIIDRRKPGKNGKFRPYLRWASLPLAIFGVLMFVKIPGLTENQYLIYAYITYIGYGMMYTAVNIPYGSLASVVTTDEGERSTLSMFRSIGAGFGGLPGQILLPLFVYSTVVDELGNSVKNLDGGKMLIGAAILAGLSVIVYQCSYKMTKERVVSASTEKQANMGKTIKTLLRNRPFIMLCIASMLLIAVQQFTQTMYNYLFTDYFEQPGLYALFTVFTYLPMAMLLPFLQKLVRRFGKKEICAAGMLFSGIAYLVLWLLHTANVWVFLAFCFLSGLGMTFFVLEVWALVTDVIDYQEHLSGQREEGTSYAFFSFTRKLGQTLAGVLGTQMLVWIAYDAKAVTAQAVGKMYNLSTILPGVMCLVMAASLGIFYPLSKKKLQELFHSEKNAE